MKSRWSFLFLLAILLSVLRLALPDDTSTAITCPFQGSLCHYTSTGWKVEEAHVAADTSSREHVASLRSQSINPTRGVFCFKFQFKASGASGANLYVYYQKPVWGVHLSETKETWTDGSVTVAAGSADSIVLWAKWRSNTHPLIYLRNVKFEETPCLPTPPEYFIPAEERSKKPTVDDPHPHPSTGAASPFHGCLCLSLALAVSAAAFVQTCL